MNAVVIAIGSELLRAGRRDTNAPWLVDRLMDHGVVTLWRCAVEDDPARIAHLAREAWQDAEAVILTGGLGPTDDDRTREAVALLVEAPLERDPAVERRLVESLARRGRSAGPTQSRQADRPRGAAWIDNPIGSAPGLLFERDGRFLAALPGVPAEMKAMFDASIVPRLASGRGGSIARRVLHVAGRPESVVDDAVRDLYASPGTETTILASSGTVELVLTAHGISREAALERLSSLERAMRGRLGGDVFGADADSLASVVGALLRERGTTVAVAESCTGGLLGATLTGVPGSSAWFRGGLVCYADDLKVSLGGVPEQVLREHGAVSEPVARFLAAGARRACGSDFGLGVTGIAGPTGGTPNKPVGTVHVALDDESGCRAVQLDGPGDRELVRRRAVAVVLDLLRRRLRAG